MKRASSSCFTEATAYGNALCLTKRHITRLYTSFYKGDLYPNQLVQPKQTASKFRQTLRSGYATVSQQPASQKPVSSQQQQQQQGASWDDAKATDLMNIHEGSTHKTLSTERAQSQRPYVPLEQAAELELQGDYALEGGLGQDALQYYGVSATLLDLAYPENHNKRAGIRIKLASAFRATGRLEASKANLESALFMLDNNSSPSLELLVEALYELGCTLELQEDPNAGLVWEDVPALVNAFHNMGESHRMMRLLPRLGRRFHLNMEEKFVYFSPFDYDRTFAICDEALHRAEQFYSKKEDSQGVIRVLTERKQLVDRKFFNMRDFTGRMRTMRGHWQRRGRLLTNAPTPEELLKFSPTIHQVYRDFKYELNAPLGREDEVQQGSNRLILDNGNPLRPRGRGFTAAAVQDAGGNVKNAVADSQWDR